MNKEIDARAGRSPSQVTVSVGENAVSMDQKEIIRVYTENRRVVISSISGRYVTRMTLQELELLLCEESFVRISRFEIVNLKKVSSFDLSMTGTIRITFEDGSDTWVARRFVRAIRDKLSENNKGGDRHE